MLHSQPFRLLPASTVLLLGVLLLVVASVEAQAQSPEAPPPGSESSASPPPSLVVIDDRLLGTWRIEAFDALADGLLEPRASSGLIITLRPNGELEGETGCGTYVGSYSADDRAIALDILLRAPEPCVPAVSDEAVGFTQALNAVRTWRSVDTGLELLDEGGRVRISLAPQAAPGPEGEWLVTAFARPNGKLQSAPADGSMNVVLGPGEELRGGTGCRLFEGAFMAQSDQILVVPLDISGLPCEGQARRAERRLLAAFERVVLWQRDGAMLRLTDADGQTLVLMAAATRSSPTPSAGSTPTT